MQQLLIEVDQVCMRQCMLVAEKESMCDCGVEWGRGGGGQRELNASAVLGRGGADKLVAGQKGVGGMKSI